jgi:hypothetical protein
MRAQWRYTSLGRNLYCTNPVPLLLFIMRKGECISQRNNKTEICNHRWSHYARGEKMRSIAQCVFAADYQKLCGAAFHLTFHRTPSLNGVGGGWNSGSRYLAVILIPCLFSKRARDDKILVIFWSREIFTAHMSCLNTIYQMILYRNSIKYWRKWTLKSKSKMHNKNSF